MVDAGCRGWVFLVLPNKNPSDSFRVTRRAELVGFSDEVAVRV